MWPRRSHTLAPLTRMASNKRKFKWTKFKKYAFVGIKRTVDCYTLLTYTYFNETFRTNTDASTFQLGMVIIQKGKLITLYIRNFIGTQTLYTVTEKEPLIIIKTLR